MYSVVNLLIYIVFYVIGLACHFFPLVLIEQVVTF